MKLMRGVAFLAFIGVIGGCTDRPAEPLTPSTGPAGTAKLAPLVSASSGGQEIPDRYIVRMKDEVLEPAALARRLVETHGGALHYTYEHAIKGFAATLPPAALTAIREAPEVVYVEPDGVVTGVATQSNATWGLDRVEQRSLPLNGSYTYYWTGSGVNAYVLDSGIRTSHSEFEGRASVGFDAFGGNGQDCHGHGTHVAGTVGGRTYGIAKGVRLIAVRVLDCYNEGTWSGVIKGVDWVTANHVHPAVANMSLGGGANTSLDDAVKNSIAKGITYVVAAGNNNADACNYSPARVAEAITVGASNSSDARWVGSIQASNMGTCLDLFAPGQEITSAGIDHDTDTRVKSGTSMAAPHVAGAAVMYLHSRTGASPSTVASKITGNATQGVLADIGSGSPNLLLYTLFPVEVDIWGASGAQVSTTETWEAMPYLGDGAYTYQWVVYWHDTGTWQHLGTEKTQSLYVGDSPTTFDISVTVTSMGTSAGASQTVTVAW